MQELFVQFTRCPGLSATLFRRGADSSLTWLTSVDGIASISSFILVVVNRHSAGKIVAGR
jgi:hypothetical protein